MVRHIQHAPPPAGFPDGLDHGMDDPVGIDETVVIGVVQLLGAHFGHLHRAAHGREHLEFLRIVRVVRRTVISVGMEDAEDLAVPAFQDFIDQTGQQSAVITGIRVRQPFPKVADGLILTHVHRGLAPVAGAPENVAAGPVQIVRQDLVKLVRVLVFEDGLHPGGGIGRRGLRHIGLDTVLHGVRVGFLPIAVQGEMVPSRRFTDDEDADSRVVVGQRSIGKRDFLHVLPLFGRIKTE